jgi:hypothetical protein
LDTLDLDAVMAGADCKMPAGQRPTGGFVIVDD